MSDVSEADLVFNHQELMLVSHVSETFYLHRHGLMSVFDVSETLSPTSGFGISVRRLRDCPCLPSPGVYVSVGRFRDSLSQQGLVSVSDVLEAVPVFNFLRCFLHFRDSVFHHQELMLVSDVLKTIFLLPS